jgi:hypothetical protein
MLLPLLDFGENRPIPGDLVQNRAFHLTSPEGDQQITEIDHGLVH